MNNEDYHHLAARYLQTAVGADCLFEVNTGAISRGYRTSPYPHESLLHLLHKLGAKLILSSDSHHADALDFAFEETRHLLKSCGFRELYTLKDRIFVPYVI